MGLAREQQRRAPQGIVGDLDLGPAHAQPQAGTQRLDEGLLGGEALGQVGRRRGVVGQALALQLAQQAPPQAVAVAGQGTLEARDASDVGADADDHGAGVTPQWWWCSCSWSCSSSDATNPASWPAMARRFISATASLRPTKSARAMIAWPMLSS